MTKRRQPSDRALGMDRPIDRRDFLNGVAVAIGAIGAGGLADAAWAESAGWPQDQPSYDPPVLGGMRGSHAGSFENAHALRDGDFWSKDLAKVETGEHYDLVIVGGGISGLSAAHFTAPPSPTRGS